MTANFVQPGNVVEYASGGTIAAGDVVVVGDTLGVALVDIGNGDTGAVQITGVFTVPKVSGAVIGQGEKLVWDASAKAFDDSAASPATGDVSGASAIAWEAAGNGVTTIAVRFTGAPGTVA